MKFFPANNRRFKKFKSRAGLRNVKIREKAANSGNGAPAAFPDESQKVIVEHNCDCCQIIYVNETGLY